MTPAASPPENPLPLPAALRRLQGIEFPRKLGLCDRLFGRWLARQGIRWVRTAPGPLWKLDLANPTHRWIVYGCYEGAGWWRWVRAHAGELRTVVDSGANIGQTVLYFARWLPEARILAYEPGRAAREWLAEGVAVNRLAGVRVEPAGLGAAAGTARLHAVGGADLHGSWNQVNDAEGDEIAIAALDGELARHGCPTVDIWKLDTEGYELAALRGAAGALDAGRIRAILLEVGPEGGASVDFLRARGYTPWLVGAAGRLRPLRAYSPWGNALFLAPGHPAAPSP